MDIGLFGINMNYLAIPQRAKVIAQHAETLGFESLWTGEHVVLPDPRQAPSPADPDTPMAHPPAFLAFLAGVTSSIKLGTGITLIAQRNPVVLAKEIATLDLICEGRFLFGIGAGYLHQEFKALGIDFDSRGPRTDEGIEVLRTLWAAEKPSYQGQHFQFDGIQAQPRPLHPQGPPLHIGGASPAAMRRTITQGHGWYGFAMDVSATKRALEALQQAANRYDRPAGLGDLEISITPPKPPTRAMLDDYAALGVSRLIPMLGFYPQETLMHDLEQLATELIDS
jgi:probable F420-dependent oxidoreductase